MCACACGKGLILSRPIFSSYAWFYLDSNNSVHNSDYQKVQIVTSKENNKNKRERAFNMDWAKIVTSKGPVFNENVRRCMWPNSRLASECIAVHNPTVYNRLWTVTVLVMILVWHTSCKIYFLVLIVLYWIEIEIWSIFCSFRPVHIYVDIIDNVSRRSHHRLHL